MKNAEKLLRAFLSQGYSFSFLTRNDIPLHQEFVKKNWPNSVTRGNYEYNKWKLREQSNNGELNLLLCKKEGKIVGQIAYVPATIKINESISDCYWGCNFKVDEQYKDAGIGAALELYAGQIYPIILGNSPSRDSIQYKKSIGFKSLEGPRTLMFPFRVNHLLRLKTPDSLKWTVPYLSFLANPFLQAYLYFVLKSQSVDWCEVKIETIENRIAKRQQKICFPYIVHEAVFLKWRFNVPAQFKKAPTCIVSEKSKNSYLVYSISGEVLNVYDYNFENQRELVSCLAYLYNKERNAYTVKVYANKAEEETMLKRVGFIQFKTRGVITAFSKEDLFRNIAKIHVDIMDGDSDM